MESITPTASPSSTDKLARASVGDRDHVLELGETIIERRSGWKAINFAELWRYRELLYFLAWRDVKVRYKQTVLGAAWAVLQPLLMMFVFTILFSGLAKVDTAPIPYVLFVYIGLLPWTYFATAMGTSSNSVVESERLITKVFFPRLLIPFGSVLAALVDFAVGSVILAILLAFFRVTPTATWALAPIFFLGIVAAAIGAGTMLSALNVKYRDFRHVIPFLIQIWMFATPSIFLDLSRPTTVGAEPPASDLAFNPLRLNPMTGLISGFRSSILGTDLPWADAAWGLSAAMLMLTVGAYVFRRVEASFADVI